MAHSSSKSGAVEILQALYDSDINFSISTLWGIGFDWKLGDLSNGFSAQGNEDKFEIAVRSLGRAALKSFPNSGFARWAKQKKEKG